MKKQYRVNFIREAEDEFYHIIQLYHDATLITTEKYKDDYKDNFKYKKRITQLEKQGYIQGYLPEDIQVSKEVYLMQSFNVIGKYKSQNKSYTFPCDIGETVYICTFCGEWYPPEQIDICEYKIKDIRITPEHIVFQGEREEGSNSYFRMEDIGVNVFLSKEEALPKMTEGIKNNFRLENLFKNKEK